MWGNMECNNHVCNNMYYSNFHISSQRISTQHSIKHSSLFITNTFITILGVNIYSTAVTTIKMAACIVCLIVTITISNPTWIITYTTYLVWKKRCEMSSLLISLFFVMSAHNFNFLFLKFGSMFRMQTWQKKTSKQLSSIY